MSERTCLGCPATIVASPRERNKRRWCTPRCRQRAKNAERQPQGLLYFPRCGVHIRPCRECGALTVFRTVRGVMCAACRPTVRAARERERYAGNAVEVAALRRDYRASLTDEQKAAAARARRAWLERIGGRPESARAADDRRRARLAGVEYEKFAREDVFERDNWTCGICGDSIAPELTYPDQLSASLDHVIPISLGGPHTRANTRASHLICNIRRGNRLDDELAA